jgi:cystathionine beta-lyase/cystathionine gamma-synthase
MPPGPSTQSVHAGEPRAKAHNSITPPIVQTSTYTFRDTAELVEDMEWRMFWEAPIDNRSPLTAAISDAPRRRV